MNTASRRRVGLAAAVALLLVAATLWWSLRGEETAPAASGDPTPTSADCEPVVREPTDGAGVHVAEPAYDTAPPSYGDHAPRWEVRAASFYTVEDRPDVSVLVHNLEHGYNILWYDQSVVDDDAALARVEEIADTYATLDREPEPATAFIAVPWTPADGEAFPDGMPYALTHWYADPTDRSRSRDDEEGVTQYCPGISSAIVEEWMAAYPLRDAPEGFPELM